MDLRFAEEEIPYWADRYEYVRDDNAIIDLVPGVQNSGHLTKDQLLMVAYWKSPRIVPLVKRNDASFVKEITHWSLMATNERSRIEVLTLMDGLLWPTASVILHFFHQDSYPILDFRALWSVSEEPPSFYDFEFWKRYYDYCRSLASRTEVSMRTLDKALWQYSKENQNLRP